MKETENSSRENVWVVSHYTILHGTNPDIASYNLFQRLSLAPSQTQSRIFMVNDHEAQEDEVLRKPWSLMVSIRQTYHV